MCGYWKRLFQPPRSRASRVLRQREQPHAQLWYLQLHLLRSTPLAATQSAVSELPPGPGTHHSQQRHRRHNPHLQVQQRYQHRLQIYCWLVQQAVHRSPLCLGPQLGICAASLLQRVPPQHRAHYQQLVLLLPRPPRWQQLRWHARAARRLELGHRLLGSHHFLAVCCPATPRDARCGHVRQQTRRGASLGTTRGEGACVEGRLGCCLASCCLCVVEVQRRAARRRCRCHLSLVGATGRAERGGSAQWWSTLGSAQEPTAG
jgi:hypothetical protein